MLNRLLGIIYVLMSKQTVTAKELAERFEVSVRTIYRDIENLSMAGIPVYTRKGKNGGISLTEQFVLNKMLVTKQEQEQILSALISLQETGAQKESETLHKLGEFFKTEPVNWVSIDLSDWSGRRQEMFELVKEAILSHKVLSFDYYGQYGDMSRRVVEPAQLIFKEYAWYLRAFCRTRQDWRLFKLLRMKRVEMKEESFSSMNKEPKLGWHDSDDSSEVYVCQKEKAEEGMTLIQLVIERGAAPWVYDRFEEEEITVLENGDFLVEARYLVDEWTYGMILSFGAAARVLEPVEVREEIIRRIERMKSNYADFIF